MQLGGNNGQANENELEYRNIFPLVTSYELWKLSPYVPEILDIVMIFLSFLPN